MNITRAVILIWPLLVAACQVAPVFAQEDSEEAYIRAIAARSRKIVDVLGIEDESKADRVQDLIAGQYRSLRDIHDSRDAKVASASENSSGDKEESSSAIEQAKQLAQIEQFELHRRFVSSLTAELTAEQVTGVKDGMTYGVVPRTYGRYIEVLPNLAENEKNTIKAFLIEAREYAMDGGSSEEKHGWFRKYKGKVNNYLSSAGYDLKEAERQAR